MRNSRKILWLMILVFVCSGYLFANPELSNVNPDRCTSEVYKRGDMSAEVITWRNESAITVLEKDRILLREAFFSQSGYNGSFIEDGTWSPDGKYFAFRLLSSGGHMPYRTPVKIVCLDGRTASLLDAEDMIEKTSNTANIIVGPYRRPYIQWLSDTKLQISVSFQKNGKDNPEMYVIDFAGLAAKMHTGPESRSPDASTDLSVPRGSSKRKAILDTLRKKIREDQGLDVIFVVEYLKARNGWAWIHTLPQSRDGKSHYEDISALLRKQNGIWKIAELPCAEEEDPACITHPAYFLNLQKRFPELPEEILPQEQ